VPQHEFVPDLDLPLEPYVSAARRAAGLGARRFCARCGLPGEPGDERHPVPAVDAERAAAAAEIDRRVLGERLDDDDDGGGS
jgi:hypothetical protein